MDDVKEVYNLEPVYYCTLCLSLKIRNVQFVENSEYCDHCGATDIERTSILNWERLYKERYGHKYIENY